MIQSEKWQDTAQDADSILMVNFKEVQGMNELTREKILAMPAERELDALVAEHVFGYKIVDHDRAVWCRTHYDELKRYSRDLYAAWEVLNVMREKYTWVGVDSTKFGWRCLIIGQKDNEGGEWHGETVNEAICKAALLAVMGL